MGPGGYAMVCEYEHDDDGNMTAMIDRGTVRTMTQLRKVLLDCGFSLKS